MYNSSEHETFESTNLRSEQDVEFQRALLADKQREAESQARRARAEQDEEDSRSEAELSAALELSKQLSEEAQLKRKRDCLAPEPPVGPDSCRLRLHFPNGVKVDRRFICSVSIQVRVNRLLHFKLKCANNQTQFLII